MMDRKQTNRSPRASASRLLAGVLLFGASLAALPAAAQKPVFTVRGMVKDQQGQAVPGAEVLLESPKLSTQTDEQGRFRLDSVPAGSRKLFVRRIGYLGVHPTISVPQEHGDTLQVTLLQLAQQLAPMMVEAGTRGIRGTVGDTAFHALPGTVVEVLGARKYVTTDDRGRFAFEDMKEGHYVLRVSRQGYLARMVTVDLKGKGQEYSLLMLPYQKGQEDWPDSREAVGALQDLGIRLALEPKRNRMTREELDRYGTQAVCDIPRVRSIVGNDPNILYRGSTWLRNMNLCAWSADQLDLLEWGFDPCKESWKSIADMLSLYCGPQPRQNLFSQAQAPRKPYVVVWPRN